jgi:hypothetical protein
MYRSSIGEWDRRSCAALCKHVKWGLIREGRCYRGDVWELWEGVPGPQARTHWECLAGIALLVLFHLENMYNS